jgi:hypothetical protein
MSTSFGSRAARAVGVVVLIAGGVVAATPSAQADAVSSNFEGLTLGSVNGQDGWQSTGGGGAPFDHYVADNSAYANAPVSFGTQSLRISNAVTSGSFTDQAFSKKTVNEAGEPGASAGAFASGTRQTAFTGQFSFAPTTSTAQPGLSVTASPDRGDGSRMSYLRVDDTGAPGGLELGFFDYRDNAPFGTPGTPADGCNTGVEDAFVFTTVATGISRTAAHTAKIVMEFRPGARDDVVKIYLDNVLVHTGTSWEDFFRWCEPGQTSRTVRSLLFRTAGTAAPATAGQGFLFDGVSSTSAPIPYSTLNAGNVSVIEGNTGSTIANVPVTLSAPYPYPVTVNYVTAKGTAKTPEDYQYKTGTLTFPANTTSAVIPITVYSHTVLEQNETVPVVLSSPTNANLGNATGTVTILNDEKPQVIAKAVKKGVEGSAVAVTVTLKQPYAYPLTLTAKTVNGTAAAPGDYTAVNTPLVFAAQNQGPKTVLVTLKKDGLKEKVETLTLQLTGGVGTATEPVKIAGNKT